MDVYNNKAACVAQCNIDNGAYDTCYGYQVDACKTDPNPQACVNGKISKCGTKKDCTETCKNIP
jgi:hypothetical protein